MKLSRLYLESIDELQQILDRIEGASFVFLQVYTALPDVLDEKNQIVALAAAVVDGKTGKISKSIYRPVKLRMPIIYKMERQRRSDVEGPTIDDMLNAAGYDVEEFKKYPDDFEEEAEAVTDLHTFIDSLDNPVLIGYDIVDAVAALQSSSPQGSSFDYYEIIDIKQFASKYVEPILRALVSAGHKTAASMLDKLIDDAEKFTPTTARLGRAFGVSADKLRGPTALIDVKKVAQIFGRMLKFIELHKGKLRSPVEA